MKRRKAGIIFGIVLCAAVLIILWASGGIQTPGTFNGSIYDFGTGQQPEPDADGKLNVMTWNIAYGHGNTPVEVGSAAPTAEETNNIIERIGEVIKDSGADLVVLQEIDFDSDRSHNTDQLEQLSLITGLRYAARAVTWKANYIPWPYWPPNRHFGGMLSGGGVLSRYPIISNQVTMHPKPEINNFIYNIFYLFRYSQQVVIQEGERTIRVVNNHLEAYDITNREKQARALAGIILNFTGENMPAIIGGDMNAIPPEAAAHHNLSDKWGDDYRGDNTLSILREVPGFKEVVEEEDYLKNESAFFTFPSFSSDRRLDHLIVSEDISVSSARVIPAGNLSDHLPVMAELTLP